MRNKNLQKKAINYGLKKLTLVIQNFGSQVLDQFSIKITPNKNYKTDRADLDGAGLPGGLLTSGLFGSPFHVDY